MAEPKLELENARPAVNAASAESARSFETKALELPAELSSLDTAYFENKQLKAGDTDKVRAEPLATNFGRYRLQSVLGRGDMGEVYLAFDTVLRRNVALKAPKLEDDSPVHRDRFCWSSASRCCADSCRICSTC